MRRCASGKPWRPVTTTGATASVASNEALNEKPTLGKYSTASAVIEAANAAPIAQLSRSKGFHAVIASEATTATKANTRAGTPKPLNKPASTADSTSACGLANCPAHVTPATNKKVST